ncbi:MAG: hypothetical protein K1X72_05940 [Pyrinomonadaceae bacterium]|nr:hypothetical protein [Pyrinomonadaceae bacterium]
MVDKQDFSNLKSDLENHSQSEVFALNSSIGAYILLRHDSEGSLTFWDFAKEMPEKEYS